MAVILGMKDNLDEQVATFSQAKLEQPLFINSVPKGGTHLLRNILRMFVPADQHYGRDFIQIPNMHLHLAAFDPNRPMLSCGHLLFGDQSVANVRTARKILLIRDPYDWVLARARFFVSDEFQQKNIQHLKSGIFSMGQLLNMMIFGIHEKVPGLVDIYTHNAAAWLGTDIRIIRYEDIIQALGDLDSPESEAYFRLLLHDAGIAFPADWKARVRTGSDRRLSRTASENLKLNLPDGVDIPRVLPDTQKALVDFHAPGLRGLLGYA